MDMRLATIATGFWVILGSGSWLVLVLAVKEPELAWLPLIGMGVLALTAIWLLVREVRRNPWTAIAKASKAATTHRSNTALAETADTAQ